MQAAGEARRAYAEGLGFSGTIVVSQLGIVVSETLQASGLDMAEANRQAGIGGQLNAPAPGQHGCLTYHDQRLWWVT